MFKLFNVIKNEPLFKHCTMRVGGNAKYYIEPVTIKEFIEVIKYCQKKQIKYFILGNGSNVIFNDKGYKGVIICTKKLNEVTINENTICAMCGVNLFVLNKTLIENSLSGLEWSYGIPGTIGGAVCMNAGAYGGEIKDVVEKIEVFDGEKIKCLTNKKAKFSYRNSLIKQNGYIVLRVWLKLNKTNSQDIQNLAQSYFNKRKISQPLEYFNSGSIFKKCNDESSGKIIDNLGLKGVKINGAQISTLHANFIVNLGNAKCEDIVALINLIKQQAMQKDIYLQEEVIFVGE